MLPSNAEVIDLVSALLMQQINQYKVYPSNEKPVLGVPDMWTKAPYSERHCEQSHLAAKGYQTAGQHQSETPTEDGSLHYCFSLCLDRFPSFLS